MPVVLTPSMFCFLLPQKLDVEGEEGVLSQEVIVTAMREADIFLSTADLGEVLPRYIGILSLLHPVFPIRLGLCCEL